MKKAKKITTYKAFDKDFKCRDFQFAVGKTYHHKGPVIACESGFHSCTNPFDVLNYYNLIESRFAVCEAWGLTDANSDDSKIASEFIKVVNEISLHDFNIICIDYLIANCADANSSGDNAQNASSGYYGYIDVSGKYSVAAHIGNGGKIRGVIGTWITLAEYDNDGNCIMCKSAVIDGVKLKEGVFYTLKNKKFTETE